MTLKQISVITGIYLVAELLNWRLVPNAAAQLVHVGLSVGYWWWAMRVSKGQREADEVCRLLAGGRPHSDAAAVYGDCECCHCNPHRTAR